MRWVVFSLSLFTLTSFAQAPKRYDELLQKVRRIQADHSGYAQMLSIGQNDDGTDIMAVRVSNSPTAPALNRIAHLVVGTHHGNELAAADYTVLFLSKLLQRYEAGDSWRTSLADTEWLIVPVLNISGYNAKQRQEHGVDPNRDYPGPCVKKTAPRLKSISLLMNQLALRQYVGTLTVHGYLGALTFPWGVDVDEPESFDQNEYERITSMAAALNGYQYGTSTDIVYPCDGSFEDYTYWKHGSWSLLMELDSGTDEDLQASVAAGFKFFDELDRSPSSKNQLTSECRSSPRPDLRME